MVLKIREKASGRSHAAVKAAIAPELEPPMARSLPLLDKRRARPSAVSRGGGTRCPQRPSMMLDGMAAWRQVVTGTAPVLLTGMYAVGRGSGCLKLMSRARAGSLRFDGEAAPQTMT